MTATVRGGSPWLALVRAAVVGTQREAAPALHLGDDQLDALLAPRAGATPESEVLRSAGILGLARRAGTRPLDLAGVALDAAPAETLARCSADAARDLLRLLGGGRDGALLPEWLALAADARVRVPEEMLPRLLAYGAARRDLHAAIALAIGARGAWLAVQQPEWSYAAGAADPERAWHEGDRAARVRALTALRNSDPAAARALLEAVWEREPPAERAAFVDALRTALSAADEPFLEAALDDRRKDVRAAAAALLARIPQSRLAQRATARADRLVTVKRNLLGVPALAVELPAECDAAMQRDGIEPRPPARTGERAWWLQQTIAQVPPSHWTQAQRLDAPRVIELAAKSDAAEALVPGLARATANYADEAWYVAWAADPGPLLLALALGDEAPVTPRYVAAVTRALDAATPGAADLAFTVPGVWDAAFSRSVGDFLRRALAEPGDWAAWSRRRELLVLAATRVAPDAPGIAEGWTEDAAEERVRTAAAEFVDTVRFRAALRAHLKAGS